MAAATCISVLDKSVLMEVHVDALIDIANNLISTVVPEILNPRNLNDRAGSIDITADDAAPMPAARTYFQYDSIPLPQLNAWKVHLASVISDQALLYRFYRKHKFSVQKTLESLRNHLAWRIHNNISSVCLNSLSSGARKFASDGLLRYFGQDRLGRPCAIFNLAKYNASASRNSIEELREFLIFALEVGRRCVVAVNEQITARSESWSGHRTPREVEVDSGDESRRRRQQRSGRQSSRSRTRLEMTPLSGTDTPPLPPGAMMVRGGRPIQLRLSDMSGSGQHSRSESNCKVGPAVKWNLPAQTDAGEDAFVFQMCVILDLDGVGMSNLNYEVIPLLYDLFHRHFPQVFGTIYVLNFGWIHSGIWSILKTILPADACNKLMFISKAQMLDHFDPNDLLIEHGGSRTDAYSLQTCPIFSCYESDPSPSNPDNHPTAQLLSVLGSINANDLLHPTDDPDVWFDALEFPPSPVKSAADLQNLLRSPSSRHISGMRLSHSLSSKALAAKSPSQTSLAFGAGGGPPSRLSSHHHHFFHGVPSPNSRLHNSVSGSYFPSAPALHQHNRNSLTDLRNVKSLRNPSALSLARGGPSQPPSSGDGRARRSNRAIVLAFLKSFVAMPWSLSLTAARFTINGIARTANALSGNRGNASKLRAFSPDRDDAVVVRWASRRKPRRKRRGGGLVMKIGSHALDDADDDDDEDELEDEEEDVGGPVTPGGRPAIFNATPPVEKLGIEEPDATTTTIVAGVFAVAAIIATVKAYTRIRILFKSNRY